jgi:hypothetical protein
LRGHILSSGDYEIGELDAHGQTTAKFTVNCPASSILSGQRQLEFPILFERYQQQSGLWEKWESRGLCGISKGGGKGGKPAFGFPRFPPPGFFHSPRPPHLFC